MGGHALKKVEASRIDIDTYNKIKVDLKNKFENKLEIEFIIDVPGKIDFGDIDILYLDSNLERTDRIDLVKELFDSVEIVINGPVCSFAYELDTLDTLDTLETNEKKYFQVDLIACDNIEMSRFYFSYGDLGGIIGRMTQHVGLSFGSAGLWLHPQEETVKEFLFDYPEKFNDLDYEKSLETITKVQYKSIILSSIPEEICLFLELDYSRWLSGFDLKEEIYNWVTKSKFCNKDSFRALDYTHRHRANKRPMYQEFLQFLFMDEPEFDIEKGNSKKYINYNKQLETIKYFNKVNELELNIKDQITRLNRKEKFSGKKFLDLGIKEKEVKNYLDNFKCYITNKIELNFEDWLDLNNKEDINLEINNFIKINWL
jgi:hypothetical protein